MAAPNVPDIDGMDWSAGSIPLGTQEAEDAQTALVRAVVEVEGSPASTSGETEIQRMWRCGKLRSSSPSAVPLLRLALQNTDHR